ncbi:MAG: OmpH family outer membrane protein [Candidatus Omnitrophica bacterium]|nr:OmpH family outer membrane protein [Candidatus Omnitrophota bacterium]
MRKLVVSLLVAGAVMFSSYAFALEIGYVDIYQIFNEYKKTKDYDKVLEEERGVKEKELEKKKEEIRKMQDKLELLKENEQEKEREKITKAAMEYRELERQYLLDLKKKRDDKMKEIVEDIDKVVEDYARKKGYDVILNKGAVLYGGKKYDITQDILRIVNQGYK